MTFIVNFTTRWADFDANVHMRHTAYNDYAAETRLRLFNKHGVTIHDFTKEKVGPILFEENTSFKKEILLGEDISVNLKTTGLSNNGERWKIQHEVFNSKGDLSAVINVYGAWLDLEKRKLTCPSKKFQSIFNSVEKTDNFKEIIINKK